MFFIPFATRWVTWPLSRRPHLLPRICPSTHIRLGRCGSSGQASHKIPDSERDSKTKLPSWKSIILATLLQWLLHSYHVLECTHATLIYYIVSGVQRLEVVGAQILDLGGCRGQLLELGVAPSPLSFKFKLFE